MTQVLRSDAKRNRAQIVDAAGRMFAERGIDVPLEEVARAAGVGVGTLYRRFADRNALLVAVVQKSVETLQAQLSHARQTQPTAWDALVVSMSDHGALTLSFRPDRLPPEAADEINNTPSVRRARRELLQTLDEVVAAAQAEGSMRPDVGTGDVAQMFVLARRRPNLPPEVAELAVSRAVSLMLDGLSTRPHDSLPGRPLRLADFAPLSASEADDRG